MSAYMCVKLHVNRGFLSTESLIESKVYHMRGSWVIQCLDALLTHCRVPSDTLVARDRRSRRLITTSTADAATLMQYFH